MLRSKAHPAFSSVVALAIVSLAASGLPGRTLAQAGSTAGAAPGATARQGLRIRFASIDGQSGVDGSGFLLFSSRRISIDAPRSDCPGVRVVRAEARGASGLVRNVEVTLHLRGQGELPIQAGGCPRAELSAALEDGTILSGGAGTVTVLTSNLTPGAVVSATYSWTASRGGTPFPMRGEFTFTLP